MSIWCGFLRESATICDPGSHGAIDDTFFDREAARRHFQYHSDCHISTLKTTALVDVESCAILDIHCSNTGRTTPKLAVESAFVTPRD